MSDNIARLIIGDVEQALTRKLRLRHLPNTLGQAFIAWILNDVEGSFVDFNALIHDAKVNLEGASRNYRHVSVLGYSKSLFPNNREVSVALEDGLKWMGGRTPFAPGRQLDYEGDGLALLGMALGIAILTEWPEQDKMMKWLLSLLAESLRQVQFDNWEMNLVVTAQLLCQEKSSRHPIVELFNKSPDLVVALASRNIFDINDEIEERAFELILSPDNIYSPIERVATQLSALHWLRRQAPVILPNRATLDEVIQLLEGVNRSLRYWCWEEKPRTRKQDATAVKWDIQHEYHVQDLLWVILAPIFPDLEDEENLPSFGHKHPRADLCIPSLRLIVEVKFVYKGNQAELSKIIGAVGEDNTLYLSKNSGYDKIIAFVWDNSRRTEEHGELKQGLEKISGVIKAVIISRPGKMKDGD